MHMFDSDGFLEYNAFTSTRYREALLDIALTRLKTEYPLALMSSEGIDWLYLPAGRVAIPQLCGDPQESCGRSSLEEVI